MASPAPPKPGLLWTIGYLFLNSECSQIRQSTLEFLHAHHFSATYREPGSILYRQNTDRLCRATATNNNHKTPVAVSTLPRVSARYISGFSSTSSHDPPTRFTHRNNSHHSSHQCQKPRNNFPVVWLNRSSIFQAALVTGERPCTDWISLRQPCSSMFRPTQIQLLPRCYCQPRNCGSVKYVGRDSYSSTSSVLTILMPAVSIPNI